MLKTGSDVVEVCSESCGIGFAAGSGNIETVDSLNQTENPKKIFL